VEYGTAEKFLSPPYVYSISWLSRYLDQETAKWPFQSSSQAATCYYQSNHSLVPFWVPRLLWVRLNRLLTGVGLFHSTMHKWGLVPLGELQMWSREANVRSHTSFLFPVPPSKWDTWFGSPRWDTVNWLETTALNIWWQNQPRQRIRFEVAWSEVGKLWVLM